MDEHPHTHPLPRTGPPTSGDRRPAGADPRADLEAGKAKAKDLAADAKDRARTEAEARKEGAAGQVDDLARAVERASEELDDNPSLSRYASELADSMHGIAGRLRGRSVDELADDVRGLARQNPALFVMGSIGVGLVLSRFMKASPRRPHSHADGDASSVDASRADASSVGASAEPVPGAVSAGAYAPPSGTSARPLTERGLARGPGDPRGRADTLRGTEH